MSQGGHFTIDFIEEQYRDQVRMIMEILCLDLKQAYELFIQSDCNVEAAVHRKTNPQLEKQYVSPPSRMVNRRNTRNAAQNLYQHQLNHSFDDDNHFDDEQYASLPIARRRPHLLTRVIEECEFDTKFNKYLQFKRKKKQFDKNYKIRRVCTQESNSIASKLFDKKPKPKQQKKLLSLNPYSKVIEQNLLERKCLIKFGKGSMSESLQSSYKTSQPLIVYHLAFDSFEEEISQHQKKPKPAKKIVKNKKMVIDITEDNPSEKMFQVQQQEISQPCKKLSLKSRRNVLFKSLLMDIKIIEKVNQEYLNFICDIDNYDYQPYFREYFPKEKLKQSFMTILRIDIFDSIQSVGNINLDEIIDKSHDGQQDQIEQKLKQVRDQLRLLRHKVMLSQRQQHHLIERFKLFHRGILHYDYIKPQTTTQKKKIKEDQEIIKMQEEQFLYMENQLREQKMKEIQKEETQFKSRLTRDQVLQKRQKVRQKLKKYSQSDPDVMLIKLRMPSAKNVVLNVSNKQKISYLFDFVYSHEIQNLGFEQEQDEGFCQRTFDIIRPEDRNGLQDKTQSTLEQIFQGSLMESLMIKEK